jgi:transcriptional regulator with XRE-family HTH domain
MEHEHLSRRARPAIRVRGSPGFSPQRLRDAREQAGLTPAGLARAAGAPRSDIAKYEAGQASPQPPRLAALARALGVPAASLLELPPAGAGLAHLRAAAGLTQAQLAGLAGIGLKRYELAELGMRPLGDGDIGRLAAATGTSGAQVRDAHRRDVGRRSRDADLTEKGATKTVSDTLQ